MAYVELHACSAFSFLRGASFPEQLAEVAAELEMPALAVLDRNGVYGAQRFSVAAREQKIRPITGCELTMEGGTLLPVLVANRIGYKNLCELLTQTHLRSSVKGECAVRWTELSEFAEGLIALFEGSARFQRARCGILPQHSLRQDAECNTQDARPPHNPDNRAQLLIDSFGPENVYVEIQRHFLRGEDRINKT